MGARPLVQFSWGQPQIPHCLWFGVTCCPTGSEGDQDSFATTYTGNPESFYRTESGEIQTEGLLRLQPNAMPFLIPQALHDTLSANILPAAELEMFGTQCSADNAGEVTVLDMRHLALRGTFPDTLFDPALSFVTHLLLSKNNYLVGSLPGTLPPRLRYIDILQTGMVATFARSMQPADDYSHMRAMSHGLMLSRDLSDGSGRRNNSMIKTSPHFMALEHLRASLLYSDAAAWPTDVLGARPQRKIAIGAEPVGMASLGLENAEIAPCWLCPDCPICVKLRVLELKDVAAGLALEDTHVVHHSLDHLGECVALQARQGMEMSTLHEDALNNTIICRAVELVPKCGADGVRLPPGSLDPSLEDRVRP